MRKGGVKYYLSIIVSLFQCELNRYKTFSANYFFELLSNIIFVIANILFWEALYINDYVIPFWNREQMYVFLAFVELFFAFKNSFYSSTARFSSLIMTGRLDVFLTQPTPLLFRLTWRNFNFFELLKGLIIFFLLLSPSRNIITHSAVCVGMLLCFMGAATLAKMQLIISYTSFWLGKIDTIYELIDALMNFNKYPINIMPQMILRIFIYILPFYTFSTNPTLFSLNSFNSPFGALTYIGYTIIMYIIWSVLERIVWKRGMRRYESYNA